MTNRNVEWTDNAWDEYIYWQTQDKKILKRINTLIKECQRTPFEGTGKPEPLKGYGVRSVWSRRIDQKHRLTYEIFEDKKIVNFLSCYGHYNDK